MPWRSVPNYLFIRLPWSISTGYVSMVTFVGIRSPPWSLPAPPRRRIALRPSLVALSFFFFFFQLPQGRQCLFEVRSVPDWHSIGTYLVRTNPPITFVIVNFLWSEMVGMIFVRKVIHFGSTNFNHIHAVFVIPYKSVVYKPGYTSFCTSSWADGRCSILCLLGFLPQRCPWGRPFFI